MTLPQSILIANRSEPVRRATRSFRKMGIRVVTIATSDDFNSPWVSEADQVVRVSSYLAGDEIIAAALSSEASGIWPGWGFLSENADFAQSVVEAGLIWVGPSPNIIALMGSKNTATEQAQKAGLQTIPEIVILGRDAHPENLPLVLESCEKVGFPVLLKPALGGGGQGQAIINKADEIKSAWDMVCQVNARQFQSGPILVQRYFTEARHIEAQVLADQHGNVVIMGERDCSIQRRNQKVIEEAPSPALTSEQRTDLIKDSTRLIHSIGYNNAGTIEYLYSNGEFFFLEMNTRLQVEHTVTEEVSRVHGEKIDLVEQMVYAAAGQKLGFTQNDVSSVGHAIEARIYAEDPLHDFCPAPGKVDFVRFATGENIRIESAMGVSSGHINPSYDPMIAKVIAWGKDRTQATCRLDSTLRSSVILGVPTNMSFVSEILNTPKFLSGDYSTRFISQNKSVRGETPHEPGLAMAFAAAISTINDFKKARSTMRSTELTSILHLFRQLPKQGAIYEIELRERKLTVAILELSPNHFRATLADLPIFFELHENSEFGYTAILGQNRVISLFAHIGENQVQLAFGGSFYQLKCFREGRQANLFDPHAAPMTGQVVTVMVTTGDIVTAGQDLYQIESMKMVTTIRANFDGTIQAVNKLTGESVKSGEVVVAIPAATKQENSDDESRWEASMLRLPAAQTSLNLLELVRHAIHGYDALACADCDFDVQLKLEMKSQQTKTAPLVAKLLSDYLTIRELFTKHAHSMTFLAERGSNDGKWLPSETVKLIKQLLPNYGLTQIAGLDLESRALIRLFQAFQNDADKKHQLLTDLLIACLENDDLNSAIVAPLVAWIQNKTESQPEKREKLLSLLYKLDADKFHELAQLPVAIEYLDEFHAFNKNPIGDIDPAGYQSLLENLACDSHDYGEFDFKEIPEYYRSYFKKWFAIFSARIVPLPAELAFHGICLFELRYTGPKTENNEVAPRFVVTAKVSDMSFRFTKTGAASLPGYERASIEAYRTLRMIQGNGQHIHNHVFLLSDPQKPIPWKTRDDESEKHALTPEIARKIAARVSGFANDIHINTTEVTLPLIKVNTNTAYSTIIEVRHARPRGVISRPPFVIDERKPEEPLNSEAQLNENQHRMGKLINPDRAMLLFDEGQYEEIYFPEVDDKPGIGLNVYQGLVCGTPTLAYASDFRMRGGALGEREGKKLASAVVLAYLSGRALIAFHDGAGANIKESIASLGWAGAYFGAIANTGGFSSKEQFAKWFKGHCERDYFELVLKKFKLTNPIDEIIALVPRQLIHFHLHVGATVGMLVYGASISHLSLMNDQPESYRVLTGSTAVARVMGENLTNYELGGAKVHAEESGDIEMAFTSEEQVINQTRKLVKLFYSTPSEARINRDAALPQVSIPTEAGVILSRKALRANIDNGDFYETRSELKHAHSLLTGYATLGGSAVAIASMATDYGLSHSKAFKKATQLVESAQDLGLPLLFISGAQWEAPSSPIPDKWILARAEIIKLLNTIRIPKLSFALGPRSIEKNIHIHMDLTVYVKRGNESEYELNSARKTAPLFADSIADAFDQTTKVLALLGSAEQSTANSNDPIDRKVNLNLPDQLTAGYEMRNIIREVFDAQSFIELWPKDNLPLITGFAKLGNRVVGIIADDPLVEGGAQNVDSIAKFTRMHRLCKRFNLPLVELNDSPAFRPGSEQEQGGIQGEGGRSIREECLSDIPKIAVTLRQNYGGRLIHANLITLGPTRKGLILENAKIGVMGAKGAVTVLYRKKLAALPESERKAAEEMWQKEYEQKQLNPQNAVELGYVDAPISGESLRSELARALRDVTQ